jgi:hypothetical protein
MGLRSNGERAGKTEDILYSNRILSLVLESSWTLFILYSNSIEFVDDVHVDHVVLVAHVEAVLVEHVDILVEHVEVLVEHVEAASMAQVSCVRSSNDSVVGS